MQLRQADGRLALAFRALPVVFALFLAVNVLALFLLGRMGGTASGQRLQVEFQASCAEQAAPLIQARADAMGLGDPEWTVSGDRIRMVATMPGLPDEDTAVPALLAQPGHLEVRSGDHVLATDDDVSDAGVQLDEAGMPYTDLTFLPDALGRLKEAVDGNPDGTLDFYLDGQLLAQRPNTIHVTDESLKVIAGVGTTRERMRRAADRAFVLDHGPHPCPVTVASVSPAR